MLNYGLYLLDNGGIFKNTLTPVEGLLHVPGTKIIAVWAELKFEGETLIETLPYEKENLEEEYVDILLNRMSKRLQERINFINSIKRGGCYESNMVQEKRKNSS